MERPKMKNVKKRQENKAKPRHQHKNGTDKQRSKVLKTVSKTILCVGNIIKMERTKIKKVKKRQENKAKH